MDFLKSVYIENFTKSELKNSKTSQKVGLKKSKILQNVDLKNNFSKISQRGFKFFFEYFTKLGYSKNIIFQN